MPMQPNIILCVCDELRAFEVACYGHPTIRTPNIDRLAASGVRFATAVSNNPVCLPARSILMSGQYSRTCCGRLGNNTHRTTTGRSIFAQWPVAEWRQVRQPTLAHRLRGAGYRTATIGKWHIEAWPDELGFDHYVIPAIQHAHTAQWFCENGGPVFSPPGYSVDYEIARVEGYLTDRAQDGGPFLLYYNISPPHMPVADGPEHYLRMYSREEVRVRPNVAEDRIPHLEASLKTYLWDYRHYRDDLPYTRHLPAGCDLRQVHAMYMGMTTWVDDTVGRLLAALQRSGLAENTIVVFTSDHGENMGSHGRMGKSTLNEESIRIPLCVSGPSIARGHVSTRIASLVDLAPTLLTCAGQPTPAHMAGRDLGPALRAEPCPGSETFALIETAGDGCGIRTATHLLGLPWSDTPRQLGPQPQYFYDLTQDPYELDNRAAAEADSALARELIARVQAWHAQTPWGN
ncbi:MAG: sulfatase-like hydrolase/transferase [Planctomycetota bacterium]